jgi:hypothetical protein
MSKIPFFENPAKAGGGAGIRELWVPLEMPLGVRGIVYPSCRLIKWNLSLFSIHKAG